MGGSCSAYGEAERVYRVLVGKFVGRDHWGVPDVDGRIILIMDLQEKGGGYLDWMELAQDRDRWRALVNASVCCRLL